MTDYVTEGVACGHVSTRLRAVEQRRLPATSSTRPVAITASAIIIIGLFHHVAPHSAHLWHNVFQWLYYLPVVYAATHFGLRGGLSAAAAAAFGYLPHFATAKGSPDLLAVQYAEVIVLFLVSGVTGALADRERKRARELERTTDELDQVYRELQDSIEQVKRADRLSAIGELSAAFAHEIRNPLASIRGAVNILADKNTPEDLSQEFRTILDKECSRLEALLTNLLDFTRPRQPQYFEVEIENMLDSVTALVGHAAGQDCITIRKDVVPGTPALECDPLQLKQVILNLVLNGIQAMPDGGEVVVAARQRGPNMLIQVTDQGWGISPENLDRIFDPFFTTKQNGTGLGLAVAHQIVTQHGGSIGVGQNNPRGMVFSVILPLRHNGRLPE